MTDFAALKKKLDAMRPADGRHPITIKKATLATPETDAFFANVIQADQIVLVDATRTSTTNAVALCGTTDVMGYFGVAAELTFTGVDGAIICGFEGTLSGAYKLPLVDWVKVTKAGVSVVLLQPYDIVQWAFTADLAVSSKPGAVVPIRIAEVGVGTWQFAMVDGAAATPVKAEDLMALLGVKTLTDFLPRQLVEALDGLAVMDLAAVVDTVQSRILTFSLAVSVINGWSDIIPPSFSLEPGLQLILTLVDPLSASSRQTVGAVRGTLMIGHTPVPVFAQIALSAGSTAWQFGLDRDPEKYTTGKVGVVLPIGDLLSLASAAAGESLPSGLQAQLNVAVTDLRVSFDTEPTTRLQSLSFGASTTEPWDVIEGFLTIENVALALVVTQAPVGTMLQFGGAISGTFAISDLVDLYLSASKDPVSATWTLTGGLAPGSTLNLTDLVGKLLSGRVTLPPQAPQIVFTSLDVEVVPGQTFTLTAGSTQPWNLVKQLSVDGFRLSVDYASGTPKGSFRASLESKIFIAQTPILISARLDTSGVATGWSFTGSAKSIAIGALVADVIKNFGVALPAAVSRLALKDLEVEFVGGTAGDSSPSKFLFKCAGTLPIAGLDIEATIAIDLERGTSPGTYTKSVEGTLTIVTRSGTSVTLRVDFEDSATDETINVVWTSSTTSTLTLDDAVSAFGFADLSTLPDYFDAFRLTSLQFTYDFKTAALAIAVMVASASGEPIGQAVLVRSPEPSGPCETAFGLDLSLALGLTALPVAGHMVPSGHELDIKDVQAIYSTQQMTAAQVAQVNLLLPSTVAAFSATGLSGFGLAANFHAGSSSQPLAIGVPAQTTHGMAPPPPGHSPSSAKWFPVNRSAGPISISRIGAEYQRGKLFFLLDASVNFSVLQLGLNGLGLGSPIENFDPEFTLSGLSVSLNAGPVIVSGGLLVVPPPLAKGVTEEFLGEVTIAIQPYLISGVASYAKIDGDPSFFVFAEIIGDFGGPPAFFITGLMGGIGYNSKLTLPAPNQVYLFPFIAGLTDPLIFGSAQPTPVQVLSGLSGANGQPPWVTPELGEDWIAAGLQFRSFELLLGKAMLVATFGSDIEIALLGLASITLPQTLPVGPPTQPYAFVELQLEAAFKPSQGIFTTMASLTPNSFLLTRDCHLTGGFAACLWFGSNAHAGDFVITVGGYHPAFAPPPWYPAVAPVGFNWPVDNHLIVKGGAYFAMTPSAAMAGGSLEAIFEAGDLKAWFIAYANLMVRWKPFHFTAAIGISIGASYKLDLIFTTKTVSVELGATLGLWGPPTGGFVHVHWYIVSFSIRFGSDGSAGKCQTVDWSAFQALLPNSRAAANRPGEIGAETASIAPAPLALHAARGLARTDDADGTWTVRSDAFAFMATSAIPANEILASGKAMALPATAPPTISIRPLGAANVHSSLSIKLSSLDDDIEMDLSGWSEPRVLTGNLPEAMWGAPLGDGSSPPPGAKTMPGLPIGASFAAPPASEGAQVGPIDTSGLIDRIGGGYLPLDPTKYADPIPAPVVSTETIGRIASTLACPGNVEVQKAIVAALSAVAAAPPTSAPLTALAASAGRCFTQPPMLAA